MNGHCLELQDASLLWMVIGRDKKTTDIVLCLPSLFVVAKSSHTNHRHPEKFMQAA
jgi:hypothetical protein